MGAGWGDDLISARRAFPAAALHAVETAPDCVRALSERGVTVHELDIERDSVPFEDETLDVIIANQILEHTKELFWVFHEVSRTLRVGGHLIVGVPNLASLHNRLLLALGHQPSPIKSRSAHIRGFTKGDVTDFLGACFPGGYVLRRFGGSNFYPFPPLLAGPLALLLPSLAWSIFFLFEKKAPYRRQFLEYPPAERLETPFFLGP
jgi:SAM-dependent methyltransferase